MKRLVAVAALAIFLPSVADAATWVFTRRSGFTEWGKAQTVYGVNGKFDYPHSKTIAEKKDEVPYRYQVGFKQKNSYLPRQKRTYQLEVP